MRKHQHIILSCKFAFLLLCTLEISICAATPDKHFEAVNTYAATAGIVSDIFHDTLNEDELRNWYNAVMRCISYCDDYIMPQEIAQTLKTTPLLRYLEDFNGALQGENSHSDYSVLAAYRLREYVNRILLPRIIMALKQKDFQSARQNIEKVFCLFPVQSQYAHFGLTSLSKIFPNVVLYIPVDTTIFAWLQERIKTYIPHDNNNLYASFASQLFLVNIELASYYSANGEFPDKQLFLNTPFIVEYHNTDKSYCYIARVELPDKTIIYALSQKASPNRGSNNTTQIMFDKNLIRLKRLNGLE